MVLMIKDYSFIKKLFIPYALIISLLGAASKLAMELGFYFKMSLPCQERISNTAKSMTELVIIGVFAVAIFLLRKCCFRKIFIASLWISGFCIAVSGWILGSIQISYFISFIIAFKLLMLFSWAYINQYTSFETSRSYYFFLNPIYCLLVYPITFVLSNVYFSKDNSLNLLIITPLAFIAVSYLIHLWIQRIVTQIKPVEHEVCSKAGIASYLGFGVILNALFSSMFLLNPLFTENAKSNNSSHQAFSDFLFGHNMILIIGVACFVILAAIFGASLLKKIGWSSLILAVALIAFASTLPLLFSNDMNRLSAHRVIFFILLIAFIIPLVQIGFTSYSQHLRLPLQATAYLVVFPLMMLGTRQLKIMEISSPWIVIILTLLMALSAAFIRRENKLLR